nr:hypothetical protein CFP56_37097 [Quercus suber]
MDGFGDEVLLRCFAAVHSVLESLLHRLSMPFPVARCLVGFSVSQLLHMILASLQSAFNSSAQLFLTIVTTISSYPYTTDLLTLANPSASNSPSSCTPHPLAQAELQPWASPSKP